MKKGFTLVELLAVIVILGVISMVTYGVITNNVKSTKHKSFEISAKNLLESAKEYVTKNMDNNDFPECGIDVTSEALEIKNNPFIAGVVRRTKTGQIELVAVTDGNFCAKGTKNNMTITEGTCDATDGTSPELKVKLIKTGTTTAQIMVRTQDSESGIESYKFCNGTDCTTYEREGKKTIIKDVIKLTDLKPATEYKIKVTSKNRSNNEDIETTTKELTIKTKEVEEPKFSISSKTYATNKVLTIKYPDNDGTYEYIYNKYQVNSNGEKSEEGKEENIKVIGTTEEIEIKSKMLVEAVIRRNDSDIISDTILIDGIDVEGPKVNVVIPDIDKWTQTKTIIIEAKDEGVGLALRPYSFDKNAWQKDPKREKIETSISNLNIKSRDRLGNINKKYTINGSTTECGVDAIDSKEICAINTIDSVGPHITFKVIEGTKISNPKYKEWYNSDKVILEIEVKDFYLSNGEEILGGSGVKSISISINDKNLTQEEVTAIKENDNYYVVLTNSMENKISVTALDNVENSRTEIEIIKLDNLKPTISPKEAILSLGNKDYNFVDHLNVVYGPTEGVTTCDPETSKKTGTYSVTCKAVANNERYNDIDISTSFDVRHSYSASTCEYKQIGSHNVYESYKCSYCGDANCPSPSFYMCYYTTSLCDCHRYKGTAPDYGYVCPDGTSKQYYCPKGGTLKGSTCNY